MCINSVFHQLNNSISSDLSTIFNYFNLALSHSLDIFVPYITLINRTYSKSPWFNTEIIKLRQLRRRLERKYASSKLESDRIAFKVLDRFTRTNVSLSNTYTSLICSVVIEYLLSRLINYLSPL